MPAQAGITQQWHRDCGASRGENVVTVQSAASISHSFLSEGNGADHLRVIAHEFGRELGGQMFVPMEHFGGEVTPVIGLTPLIAGIIARDGYSKDDVRRYVFEHARVPARDADANLNRHQLGLNLHESVRLGRLPPVFARSDDPDRRVPVRRPEARRKSTSWSRDRPTATAASSPRNSAIRDCAYQKPLGCGGLGAVAQGKKPRRLTGHCAIRQVKIHRHA